MNVEAKNRPPLPPVIPLPWELRQRELKVEKPFHHEKRILYLPLVIDALSIEQHPNINTFTEELTRQFNNRLGGRLPDDEQLENFLFPPTDPSIKAELRRIPLGLRKHYNGTLKRAARSLRRNTSHPATIGDVRAIQDQHFFSDMKGIGPIGAIFLVNGFKPLTRLIDTD